MSSSRKASAEIDSALSDFASENEVVSPAEIGALESTFISEEEDSVSPGEPPQTEGGHRLAGDTRVGAKYLLPLAIAVVAVLAVERVTMWRSGPVAAPTESPTAEATELPTASSASPTVSPRSAPIAPAPVMTAAQRDVRTLAGRVAPIRPAPAERSLAGSLRLRPPARPARNSRPDLMEVPPMSAPAPLGITARTLSVETLSRELPPATVTETAAVATPTTPVAEDVEAVDKAAIDRVLGTYQESYSALDAAMVSTIWRGLDTRGLQRAFNGLDSQKMSFDHCDVTVEDDKARASCTGVLDYVRKIGQTNPLQKRLSWSFDLQRTDDRWLISKVEAR